MKVYQENATEVYIIEQKKNLAAGIPLEDSVPQFLVDTFRNQKKEGAQATRNRGFKHLTKVGFCGDDSKPVPRWATDQETVQKIAQYQKTNHRDLADKVFGRLSKNVAKEVNAEKQLRNYK